MNLKIIFTEIYKYLASLFIIILVCVLMYCVAWAVYLNPLLTIGSAFGLLVSLIAHYIRKTVFK